MTDVTYSLPLPLFETSECEKDGRKIQRIKLSEVLNQKRSFLNLNARSLNIVSFESNKIYTNCLSKSCTNGMII